MLLTESNEQSQKRIREIIVNGKAAKMIVNEMGVCQQTQ